MARSVTMKKTRQKRERARQVVVRYFVCRCGRVRMGITVEEVRGVRVCRLGWAGIDGWDGLTGQKDHADEAEVYLLSPITTQSRLKSECGRGCVPATAREQTHQPKT
jgi:hypothetical protein